MLPFYGAIMWATITALLFVPVYRRLLPRVKGRRSTAAAWVMLIVLLGCVLPFALVTAALAREASVIYQHIDPGEWRPGLCLRGLFAPRCTRCDATLSDPPRLSTTQPSPMPKTRLSSACSGRSAKPRRPLGNGGAATAAATGPAAAGLASMCALDDRRQAMASLKGAFSHPSNSSL